MLVHGALGKQINRHREKKDERETINKNTRATDRKREVWNRMREKLIKR